MLSPSDHSLLVEVVLACVDREYPNQLDHVISGGSDLRSPAELHPAFFGSYDWHSSVHNHWLLVRALRGWPVAKERDRIVGILDDHLSPDKLAREVEYFSAPANAACERPYGWVWVLALHAEAVMLARSTEAAKDWASAIEPLREIFVQGLLTYLEGDLRFPVRTGTHANTAFALELGLDSAATLGDEALAKRLGHVAVRLFGDDVSHPDRFEPSGGDFLSPALCEAALMGRILAPEEFAQWLARFLPGLVESPLLAPPRFTPDWDDPATVHLDGLLLSRGWSLALIARRLPSADVRRPVLVAAAHRHVAAATPVTGPHDYLADHWMPTYVAMAHEALDQLTDGSADG
jgi:hypothetical protein